MTIRHILRTMPLPERIGLWLFAWSAPVLALGVAVMVP